MAEKLRFLLLKVRIQIFRLDLPWLKVTPGYMYLMLIISLCLALYTRDCFSVYVWYCTLFFLFLFSFLKKGGHEISSSLSGLV